MKVIKQASGLLSEREREYDTQRQRLKWGTPMRPNNSGIKKKSSCGGGAGRKRGKKTKIKQHNILREKKWTDKGRHALPSNSTI